MKILTQLESNAALEGGDAYIVQSCGCSPEYEFHSFQSEGNKKIGFLHREKISFQFVLKIVFLYGYINFMRLSYSCHISSPNARKFYVRVPNDMHMPIYGNIELLRKDAFQLLCLKS